MTEDSRAAVKERPEPIDSDDNLIVPVTLKRSGWRRPRTWVIIAIVVVVVLVALFISMRSRGGSSASQYLTSEAVQGNVVSTVAGSGEVVDQYTYTVAPGASPILAEHYGIAPTGSSTGSSAGSGGGSNLDYHTTSISKGVGDAVTAGQTIAVAKQQASQKLILQRAVNDAQTQRDNATVDEAIALANSQLANAKDALAAFDVKVTSPVNGRIRSIQTAVGAAATQVATIGSGKVAVSVMVSEYDVDKVVLNQDVNLTVGSSATSVKGKVASIAQQPDDSSGVVEYQVVITSDGIPATARVGMTVSATIDVKSVIGVVSVPSSAITTDAAGQSTVTVLADRNQVDVRTVTLGLVGNTTVEILSGVTAGETVVTGTNGTVPARTTGGLGGGLRG